MSTITFTQQLNETTTLMRVKSPDAATRAKAGQFAIIQPDAYGERIPLTIADTDKESGEVTVIFQRVGRTTDILSKMSAGDTLAAFAAPLGKPTDFGDSNRVLIIGGGVGTAIAYPSAKSCRQSGKSVDGIIGFRSRDLVILEQQFRGNTDNLQIMTDDGSYGERGFVTDKARQLLSDNSYDLCVAIGPIPMMKAVCLVTKKFGVKTLVSLNPIMIDGTGMCGCCRVSVGGETKFACVDGPDFDGALVDFDELSLRNKAYLDRERCDKDNCRLYNQAGNQV
ncbi:MAG: sulfide/dihydroorotate dehydrogenase-like FAD/NAD-binding protein [Oscillospiraceae bacterium]|jgi:ferredoxin--NADP+ reductase|nr:sulfide/dihydroorotate dehydrogenase-like FAD/NAD-binding protein [Oscillospiraceae bacterium]